MDKEQILNGILDKFTGNIDDDFKIVLDEAEHFRKLEQFEMMKDVIYLLERKYGELGKQKLINAAQDNIKKRKELYKEMVNYEKNKEFMKAQEIIVKLIDTFPIKRPMKENDAIYSFNNLFEHMYYLLNYNAERKNIIKLEEPVANYYFHLGFCLFNLEDYEEVIDVLDKSLELNPVQVDSVLLQAEAYYKLGYTNKFLDNIDRALLDATNKFQLANSYFLLAKYYFDLCDKETAYACCILSRNFVITKELDSLFEEVKKMNGENLDFKDLPKLQEILKSHKIQFGPSPKVLTTLKKLLQDPKTKESLPIYYYFLNMAYDLTHDFKLKEEIDKLKKSLEQVKFKKTE